ncbi:MAG: CYTH domain-containing protein [Bacteroidetes bacterium]|nr:MAG: CYTH domain-containing protein [Bacteroidota bacterium]
MHLNVEIKARCAETDRIRQILAAHQADYRGTDHQIDTYFIVPYGRLKLRQGNIETNLIHYQRDDQAGPKASQVQLYKPADSEALKAALSTALGIKTIVDKQREIYFIDNVKFHLDSVQGLGHFVEIEAIDFTGQIGHIRLEQQCTLYLELFGIRPTDLLTHSYSDMILANG